MQTKWWSAWASARRIWCSPAFVTSPALPVSSHGGEPDGTLTALTGEQDSFGDIQRVEVVAGVGCHVGTAPDNNVLLRLHWEGFLVRGFPARTPSFDPSAAINLSW